MQNPQFQVSPPIGLLERIIRVLANERRILIMRKYFGLVVVGFALALTATVPALVALLSDIGRSGFIQYLMLIFSDWKTILSYWQDYSLSLLETLPAVSAASLIAVILFIALSIKFFQTYIKVVRENRRLIPH